MTTTTNIDKLAMQTIRTLSMDVIEKAGSGHPGMPMGAAPMAYTLWSRFFKTNPDEPKWINRDRFVLSAGHGSMLLYSLLHLSGYDLSLEDLKNFRQWGSLTPGHPEFDETPGVDATTGPLGQGIAMSVGMAMAEQRLASMYNTAHYDVIDHYTYAICGDGDLMEGVSAEAASLAGHLQLGKLIVLYDSNDISLDGDLDRSFSEDVGKRFEAYNWQVIRVEDGEDTDEITKAIEEARANLHQPTLIEVKTTIGFGSPNKAGSSASHGAPLGEDEIIQVKENYGWSYEEPFYVPDEVYDHYKKIIKESGQKSYDAWKRLFSQYENSHPKLAKQLKRSLEGHLPEKWEEGLPQYDSDDKGLATRAASGEMIQAIAEAVPTFFGGSADLAGSNKTLIKDSNDFAAPDYTGRNIWFGVREFAMASALNGMALHGGLNVFGGTFFVFSDYLRPALRLSALMKLPVTYVLTHDSIAVGEDGPTHEPIEQLPALRAMPGLSVIRPADGNETRAAWKLALTNDHPTALVLTRQGLPILEKTAERAEEGVQRGAYVVSDSSKETIDALLLASGSEVSLAVQAQKQLEDENISVRVISMPSWDRFEKQDREYREQVLPKDVKKRVAIEMASPLGWERYTGDEGDILGIDTFGASAPGGELLEKYGFTPEHVVARVKNLLSRD